MFTNERTSNAIRSLAVKAVVRSFTFKARPCQINNGVSDIGMLGINNIIFLFSAQDEVSGELSCDTEHEHDVNCITEPPNKVRDGNTLVISPSTL